jgi:hypothetical protein
MGTLTPSGVGATSTTQSFSAFQMAGMEMPAHLRTECSATALVAVERCAAPPPVRAFAAPHLQGA